MTSPTAPTPQDRQVDLADREVPKRVRQAVLGCMKPGDTLWRCPRRAEPKGLLGALGLRRRRVVIEWWLLNRHGDLVEAFWET